MGTGTDTDDTAWLDEVAEAFFDEMPTGPFERVDPTHPQPSPIGATAFS